jgi:hypothetical protein
MFSNVMISVPISGAISSVSFFEDDTIEIVRQQVALVMNSHPDRLFIQIKETFPKDWYENPKHWTALFYRLAYDGKTIPLEQMRTYLTQVRIVSEIVPRAIDLSEWESRPEFLKPLFVPDEDFEEWRILGTDPSMVMPLPPTDLPTMKPTQIPQPNRNVLFETIHRHQITEISAVEIQHNPSQLVMRNYYPYFLPDTPLNIESLRESLIKSRNQLQTLLSLEISKHKSSNILKAKWYIPFVSTEFSAPRVRFEQMFYGMTLSPETPYLGYFTSKKETTRHKFYVEDPKNKVPILDTGIWKFWTNNSQPQRKLPTLLFYRGSSKHSYDRIAVTNKDITISISREKGDTSNVKKIQEDITEWLMTFDALIPFIELSDIQHSRWEMAEMSLIASYENSISNFDMRRFSCLSYLFSYDKKKDIFRFLRTSSKISQNEIRAYQLLSQSEEPLSPEFFAVELGISIDEARALYTKVNDLDADFDTEKLINQYPALQFSPTEVAITFATNPERILHYTDILRYVLTTQSDDVDLNEVCPRRAEIVESTLAVPVQNIQTEFVYNEELSNIFGEEEMEGGVAIKNDKKPTTYNYFNSLLKKFEPEIEKEYPKKCEKLKQVVVLTENKQEKLGEEYNYVSATPSEKIDITSSTGEKGTAICPPFWCIRDEIPLREDQLVDKNACPVCGGKVRTGEKQDTLEYSVIKRASGFSFPSIKEARSKMPCCYKEPRTMAVVLQKDVEKEEIYILNSVNIGPLRLAYLPPDYLGIKTNYEKTVEKGRIGVGKSDIFRIGIGRPSKTLPILFKTIKVIPRPKDAPEKLKSCSFFRTWSEKDGNGDNAIERIISSIDAVYEKGELGVFEELEYVTSILECKVIRIVKDKVVCGFWSEILSANSRTIVVTETGDIIGRAERTDKKAAKSKFKYDVDIRHIPAVYSTLHALDAQACSFNVPQFNDAVKEIRALGKTDYEIIRDPFGRVQALIVPSVAIFPINPSIIPELGGIPVRSGYDEVKDEELPENLNYLKNTAHPGYKLVGMYKNFHKIVTEGMLSSGFRVPVRPYEDDSIEDVPREVIETIRKHNEEQLVNGKPNAEDIKLAERISYTEEVFQFLLFSLSKDIQKTEYEQLRGSIISGTETLYKDLDAWLKAETYWDDVVQPNQFLNKVRKPCGQLKDENVCKKSSMCGWYNGNCKIKIKSTEIDRSSTLRRIVRTLKENTKQRSLVVDERLSPFFSTILYLEMPHELITTSI